LSEKGKPLTGSLLQGFWLSPGQGARRCRQRRPTLLRLHSLSGYPGKAIRIIRFLRDRCDVWLRLCGSKLSHGRKKHEVSRGTPHRVVLLFRALPAGRLRKVRKLPDALVEFKSPTAYRVGG
jgi:hypothetical protein